jgi:hypothetical protein
MFKLLLCVLHVPELNIVSEKLKFIRQMKTDAFPHIVVLVIYSVLYLINPEIS